LMTEPVLVRISADVRRTEGRIETSEMVSSIAPNIVTEINIIILSIGSFALRARDVVHRETIIVGFNFSMSTSGSIGGGKAWYEEMNDN
jgi:hypothetical protein